MGTTIGFDISKRFTQAAAMTEDGRVIREGRCANERSALAGFLAGLPLPWQGVMETGLDWEWVYETLMELGVAMVVAHPKQVKAIAQAKVKTDRVDARMLAHLKRANLIPEVYVPGIETRDARQLWRERLWVVRMRTRLKNRIHRLLGRYHVSQPGVSDLFGAKGRAFLERVKLPDPGEKLLRHQCSLFDQYSQRIQDLERWALARTQTHRYQEVLKSLPGFGPVLSSIVALELDTPERFAEAGKMASYCGLVPEVHSSGGVRWMSGVGRQGNRWLKWAFIEATWQAVRSSPYFRQRYERLKRKKPNSVAVVACARHLCEIAYRVMKEGRPYEERPWAGV